jgi:hypothetical protein
VRSREPYADDNGKQVIAGCPAEAKKPSCLRTVRRAGGRIEAFLERAE